MMDHLTAGTALDVLVANALGLNPVQGQFIKGKIIFRPEQWYIRPEGKSWRKLPPYSQEPELLGFLIRQARCAVGPHFRNNEIDYWEASSVDWAVPITMGRTPEEAVCKMLIRQAAKDN